MSLKLTTLIAAAVALVTSPARAEYGRHSLAIELLVAPDEVPGLVCVVHRSEPDPKSQQNESASLPLAFANKSPGAKAEFLLQPIEGESDTFQVRPSVQCPDAKALPASQLTAAERAQCLLRHDGKASTCSAERCAPVVKIDAESASHLRVTCAEGVSGDPERVLVLKLHLPGDREGEVYGVSLDGTVVSIDGAWGERRPSASVLGGHYHAANAASARLENRMQLRVEARCTRRLLELPAIIRGAGHATGGWRFELYPDGNPPSSEDAVAEPCKKTLCTRADNKRKADPGAADNCIAHSVPVMVARDPRGGRVAAALHLPANPNGDAFDAQFEARVDVDDRQGPLRLQLYGVRFDWRLPCEFHGRTDDECPQADLIEAGVTCKSRRFQHAPGATRCEYNCNVPEGAGPFALPVTVRFAAAGQEDAWREQLTHIDQTLSGYAPLFERQFGFAPAIKDRECKPQPKLGQPSPCACPDDKEDALSGKCETRFDAENNPTGSCVCPEDDQDKLSVKLRPPGDQINKLTVWTPSGPTYEFNPTVDLPQWPIVTVAGGRCGAPLTYRFSGTRSFDVASTSIERGQILVPSPDDSAVRWSWGGLAAYALTLPFVSDVSLDQPPPHPGLLVKLAGRLHPLRSAWTFEGAATGLFSNTPYYGLQVPSASSHRDRASAAASWRVGGELAATKLLPPLWFFPDGWGIGFLVGAGARVPAYRGGAHPLSSCQFYFTAGMFIRSRVAGPLWLDASIQYIGLEHARHFSSSDLLGKLTEQSVLAHTLLITFGPRFWF